jgi:hypothetical protein
MPSPVPRSPRRRPRTPADGRGAGHLRVCQSCGHVGSCDRETGHPGPLLTAGRGPVVHVDRLRSDLETCRRRRSRGWPGRGSGRPGRPGLGITLLGGHRPIAAAGGAGGAAARYDRWTAPGQAGDRHLAFALTPTAGARGAHRRSPLRRPTTRLPDRSGGRRPAPRPTPSRSRPGAASPPSPPPGRCAGPGSRGRARPGPGRTPR